MAKMDGVQGDRISVGAIPHHYRPSCLHMPVHLTGTNWRIGSINRSVRYKCLSSPGVACRSGNDEGAQEVRRPHPGWLGG